MPTIGVTIIKLNKFTIANEEKNNLLISVFKKLPMPSFKFFKTSL